MLAPKGGKTFFFGARHFFTDQLGQGFKKKSYGGAYLMGGLRQMAKQLSYCGRDGEVP